MSHARLNNQEQRKQHRKELTQPWRDGEISREFLDYYPDKKEQMIKEKIITREQANKAKKVWGNDDII